MSYGAVIQCMEIHIIQKIIIKQEALKL